MNNYLHILTSLVQTNCGPKFVSSDSTSVRTAGRWIKWRRCESAVKTNFGSKLTSFISTSTRHARRQIKWRKIWGQNSSKHWIYIYCSRFICLRRIIRLRLMIYLLMYKFCQYLVDCSQSPIFSWDRLYIPRLTVTAVLFFKCTEGVGVGDYILGGGRGEKNRGTVITSLQLAFTECVVPATQAFDWSLDNRC